MLTLLLLFGITSCIHTHDQETESQDDTKPRIVMKRRDDGTLSSVNQVDEDGRVDGVRITYFADGKTMHSKLTFSHGIKEGPAIRYYNNGRVFEHTGFKDGKKHGPARKYYRDGRLLSECRYDNGIVLPGLKEYDREGTLITAYPEIHFREIDHLASRNRMDLEIYCSEKDRGVKYFLSDQKSDGNGRTYLISENSRALIQFYVQPGEILDRQVEVIAEIPTELGNVLARKLTYHLVVKNLK
jgi:antitoxin component YwqK of YwqJK toxin-antitoxin module